MSEADARRELFRALGELRKRDPAEIEAAARAAGAECPYDSQWLVRAAVRAAKRLGVQLRPQAGDAKFFKSVGALASYLQRQPKRRAA